jgi:hypothetical protein
MAEIEVTTEACRLAARDVFVTFCEFFVVLVKVMKYLHFGMDPCFVLRIPVINDESLGYLKRFIYQR